MDNNNKLELKIIVYIVYGEKGQIVKSSTTSIKKVKKNRD